MPLILARFVDANQLSPVEYFSAEKHSVTLRLADGQRFDIPARQFREIGNIRFAHAA